MDNQKKLSSRHIKIAVIGVAILLVTGSLFFIVSKDDKTGPITVTNGWATLTINKTEIVGSAAQTITGFAELVSLREEIYYTVRECVSENGTDFARAASGRNGSVLGGGGMTLEWPVEMDIFILYQAEPTSYWCKFTVEITDYDTEEMRTLIVPIHVTVIAP